jgi:hypothetical protein
MATGPSAHVRESIRKERERINQKQQKADEKLEDAKKEHKRVSAELEREKLLLQARCTHPHGTSGVGDRAICSECPDCDFKETV